MKDRGTIFFRFIFLLSSIALLASCASAVLPPATQSHETWAPNIGNQTRELPFRLATVKAPTDMKCNVVIGDIFLRVPFVDYLKKALAASNPFTANASQEVLLETDAVSCSRRSPKSGRTGPYYADLRVKYRLAFTDNQTIYEGTVQVTGRAAGLKTGPYYAAVIGTEKAAKAIVKDLRDKAAVLTAKARTARKRQAEERQRQEAERQRRAEFAEFRRTAKRVNEVRRVVEHQAIVREFPDAESQIVTKLTFASQVQVVLEANNGWLQISREGKPLGWTYRSALGPMQATTAPTATAEASPSGPARRAQPSPYARLQLPRGASNPDAIALIIGNRNYEHQDVPAVEFAHNDAALMRNLVRQTFGYTERNILYLEDARQSKLLAYLGAKGNPNGRLKDHVRPGKSDVFVYYSGHGVPGAGRNGYLLSTDADPGKPELTGYSLDTLVENLNALGARSVTLVLDTCFSGISQGGALVRAASPVYLKARQITRKTDAVILTAADGDQVASWDTKAKLGLFTRHFVEGLVGRADRDFGNGDGTVTLGEMRGYLASEVTYEAPRAFGRDQRPTVQGIGARVLNRAVDPTFKGLTGEAGS